MTVLELYRRFYKETGDPVAASNLVVAHMLRDEPLTVSEAAAKLKCSEKKVYRMCKAGQLTSQHIGRSIRITPESLDRYLRNSETTDEFDD